MRYHICSRDNYFRKGFEAILDKVPANAISCGGETLFIDLSHPADINKINKKEICHIFFIGDSEAVFDFLKNVKFSCDTYFITKDVAIDKCQKIIESFITSIILRHCFWSGVRSPLPQRDDAKHLALKEKKRLQCLKDRHTLIKTSNNIELMVKATLIHQTSTKIRGGNFIQHNLKRQASFIERFHTLYNDKQNLTYLSDTEACRQISGSSPMVNNLVI